MLGTRVVIKEFFPKNIAARTNGTVGPREDVAPYMYENRLESFCSEAKLLSSLAGTPGVLSIKDAFRSNGTAYIVTEYFEGKTLAKYLDENGGRLGWNDTASILAPVSKALKILHDKGIIHKDVSPSNILVTHNGGMLIDYGSVVSSERTLKHGYAPLELYSSNIPASAATDIYALAATAYKCLTGITPAQATDRIIEDTLQKPSKSGSDITRTAEGYLMQALAIRPEPLDPNTNPTPELRALFTYLTVQYGTPELITGKFGSPQDIKTEKTPSGAEIQKYVYKDFTASYLNGEWVDITVKSGTRVLFNGLKIRSKSDDLFAVTGVGDYVDFGDTDVRMADATKSKEFAEFKVDVTDRVIFMRAYKVVD